MYTLYRVVSSPIYVTYNTTYMVIDVTCPAAYHDRPCMCIHTFPVSACVISGNNNTKKLIICVMQYMHVKLVLTYMRPVEGYTVYQYTRVRIYVNSKLAITLTITSNVQYYVHTYWWRFTYLVYLPGDIVSTPCIRCVGYPPEGLQLFIYAMLIYPPHWYIRREVSRVLFSYMPCKHTFHGKV